MIKIQAMVLTEINRYYTSKLQQFGANPRGVDWSSEESQILRFDQLVKLFEGEDEISIADYGCGYGALASYLLGKGLKIDYFGYDISKSMIQAATANFGRLPSCTFSSDESLLSTVDFTLASGIFNVKLHFDDSTWENYITSTLEKIHSISRRGFAFNALSIYSDPERRRPDLHYADPLQLFDHCKRNYSRFVALLHDYPLFEFTILVRKGGPR
jgi:SAM-dependent methyltransferase